MSIKNIIKKVTGLPNKMIEGLAVKYYKSIWKQHRDSPEIQKCCMDILDAIKKDDDVLYNAKCTELGNLLKVKMIIKGIK